MTTSNDPLLQPYRLKHLTLKNRIMSTSHEPAYSEDGMPKDRYRLYHLEKARGGIAMTMTAGSAAISRDSPPAFGNLLAYTLLTETVFQWPGMGFLFLEAVTRADVPLITTYLVAVGLLFVVTNTLVDLVSLWLDPRVSLEGRR